MCPCHSYCNYTNCCHTGKDNSLDTSNVGATPCKAVVNTKGDLIHVGDFIKYCVPSPSYTEVKINVFSNIIINFN